MFSTYLLGYLPTYHLPVLGGYLIFMITVSSRPYKKKNGSESQSKSVSAVLKGKKEGNQKKKRERISELPVLVISDSPVSGRYLFYF
jgi:hypothetical protein